MFVQGEVNVLGGQDWDGKGNVHIYANAFLFATAQSKVFYAYTDTPTEKEMWMRAIQLSVVTTPSNLLPHSPNASLATPNVAPTGGRSSSPMASPTVDAQSQLSKSPEVQTPNAVLETCLTRDCDAMGRTRCHSCDHWLCDKHLDVTHKIPLLQSGLYLAQKCCAECYRSQLVVNFVKNIVERLQAGLCVYPSPLDLEHPIVLVTTTRPSHTPATSIALSLFHKGEITAEELEQLLSADQNFLDHTSAPETEIPLDLNILALHRQFRAPDFDVCKAILLLHQHLDQNVLLFKPIVEKLLAMSFTNIENVEFYWPQIVHAYLRLPLFSFTQMFWLDEFILSVCSRSIHLALQLMWQLQGALEDCCVLGIAKDVEDRYTRIVRLMLAIEVEIVGHTMKQAVQHTRRLRPVDVPRFTETQLHVLEEKWEECRSYQWRSQQQRVATRSPGSPPVATTEDRTMFNNPTLDSPKASYVEALCHDRSRSSQDNVHELPLRLFSPASRRSSSSPLSSSSGMSSFQKHLLTPKDPTSPNFERSISLPLENRSERRSHSRRSSSSSSSRNHSIMSELGAEGMMMGSSLMIEQQPSSSVHQLLDERKSSCTGQRPRGLSSFQKFVLSNYFSDEREFVDQITEIAEKMRFVQPPSERKKELSKCLDALDFPELVYIPLVKATDAFERIIRIPPNEATAFSTKARVPIMLIFEVIRGQQQQQQQQSSLAQNNNNNDDVESSESSNSQLGHQTLVISLPTEILTPDDEDLEVDRLIESESPDLYSHLEEEEEEEEEKPDSRRGQAPPTPMTIDDETVCDTPGYDLEEVENSRTKNPFLDRTESKMQDIGTSVEHQKKKSHDPSPEPTTNTEDHPTTVELTEAQALERETIRKSELHAAFGESWDAKRERLRALSPFRSIPGWDVVSMIGKSNDDLRQEVFALQIIQKFADIFKAANLPLWLKSYRILGTSSSTGLIETLVNAISLDGLKKRDGYVNLRVHFEKSYGPPDSLRYQQAHAKYIQSMAAYALVTYLMQIKDRVRSDGVTS